jgi:hypothetical protein
LKHSASSISEIEKATIRIIALRQHDDNKSAAARCLGMAPISLCRWFDRPGVRPAPDRESARAR